MDSAAKGIATINKLEKFRQFQAKVLSSPILFMELWLVPPICHHIIFNWLRTIGPILYFFAGIAFTLAAQLYACIVILSVPHSQYNSSRRFYTTDDEVRENMAKKRQNEFKINDSFHYEDDVNQMKKLYRMSRSNKNFTTMKLTKNNFNRKYKYESLFNKRILNIKRKKSTKFNEVRIKDIDRHEICDFNKKYIFE